MVVFTLFSSILFFVFYFASNLTIGNFIQQTVVFVCNNHELHNDNEQI